MTDLITIIIIAITVIISYKGFGDYNFFDRYKFQPGPILKHKQYDRLLSSGFLHVNTTHLLFNMITLYFFAWYVINFFSIHSGSQASGSVIFAVVYLAAILGGNLLSLFFQKNNYNYSAVGASGGVSGILFASIVIDPNIELLLFFILPIKGWIFAILYLGYSIYGMKNQLGNIGHEAHLGGSIIGLIAPILVYPNIFEQHKFYILVMIIPISVLLLMALKQQNKLN